MISDRSYGVAGYKAPEWGVNRWLNLPDRTESLSLADYEGKVVYLYFFQAWCPGCHSHGFPTLNAVKEQFAGNDDVAFVAIQTVFEGFDSNTLEAAEKTAERHGLDFPVGHDVGPDGNRSQTMQDYRSGGTPWTVLIDKNGNVRFNDFRATPDGMAGMIDQLLAE